MITDDVINEMVMNTKMFDETPSDEPTRYKTVENDYYEQLRRSQDQLDEQMDQGDWIMVDKVARMSKVLLESYNETCRLRKIAEIECGKIIPMSVLENYQKEILPAIASGIDNLRLEVTNKLKPLERASFQAAWNQAYPKFVSVLGEAAGKLQKYIEQAKLEASGNGPNKKYVSVKERERKEQSARLRHARENLLGKKGKR